jgi:hypothetical protein
MTSEERDRWCELQREAGDIWAQVRALAALTARIAQNDGPPFSRANGDAVPSSHTWGGDRSAAGELCSSIEDRLGALLCKLDPMTVEMDARRGAGRPAKAS